MFTSPITPTDTMRQAIPASYINMIVVGDIDLDLYLEINGRMLSHSTPLFPRSAH